MKLAVFGGIYGNLTALSACFAFAEHLGAEGYAFLGDLVGECPDPSAVVQLIGQTKAEHPCYFVRGECEEMLIAHKKSPSVELSGSLQYTFDNLSEQEFDFIASMPKTARIEIDNCPPIQMCYGSPASLNDTLFPGSERADVALRNLDANTLLASHLQMQFRYESGGKQLINPGVIGMHNNHQTKAQFALLDCVTGRWTARMLNVDYDREAELARFDGCDIGGMRTVLVRRSIGLGENRIGECLSLAQKLAQVDKNSAVDETYWETSAKQLGLI